MSSYQNQTLAKERLSTTHQNTKLIGIIFSNKELSQIEERIYQRLFSTYFRNRDMLTFSLQSSGIVPEETMDGRVIQINEEESTIILRLSSRPLRDKKILFVLLLDNICYPFAVHQAIDMNKTGDYPIRWVEKKKGMKTKSSQCFL